MALYDQYLDAISVEETVRVDSYEEGREEGRKEKEAALKEAEQEKEAAVKKEKIETAKSMLLKGIDSDTISEITKLPKEEIQKLML